MVNSSVNFLIYCAVGSRFRNALSCRLRAGTASAACAPTSRTMALQAREGKRETAGEIFTLTEPSMYYRNIGYAEGGAEGANSAELTLT